MADLNRMLWRSVVVSLFVGAAACGAPVADGNDAANKLADTHITTSCLAGGCNITRGLMSCSPAGPGPNAGFSMGVSVTYSCNEPVGCQ
ncbi:hypothetical protein ACLEPN_02855 [Myxococcus sp. 1LA]